MTEKEKEYFREYHRKNKDKKCEMAKKWRIEHPEQYKQTRKKYSDAHKDDISKKYKEYYEANKERLREYKKKWAAKNKTRLAQKNKEWKTNNPEKVKSLRKRYSSKLKTKIVRNLRNRLWHAVKKGYKSDTTIALLGCSVDFLLAYLESLFTDGMSWDNYSFYGWHIDHIIPCASFDLTDPEQQKRCFHYTNLQPLWGIDNMAKGDKVPV